MSCIEGPSIKVTKAIQKWNIISPLRGRERKRERKKEGNEARNGRGKGCNSVRQREREGGGSESERTREERFTGWIRGMTAPGW